MQHIALHYGYNLHMESLKIVFFVVLGIYTVQCIIAKKIQLNWVLILIAVGIHAFYFFTWEGLLFLLLTGILSTAIELMSLKTPLNVFGVAYKYNLESKYFPSNFVLSKVFPIEVSAAWILLKYLSVFMSLVIVAPLDVDGIVKIVIGALILVSFDLLLDPYAVSKRAWQWKKPGIFFNVPWQNFFGWFIVGLVTSVLFANMHSSEIHDATMGTPVFIVSSLFPVLLNRRLVSMNKIKGILALLPLTSVIVIGLFFLFV